MTVRDFQAAYEASEAARIAVAAELASTKATLRRERALNAHPALNRDLISLVRGETDEEYASQAAKLADAIEGARVSL